MTPCTKVSSRTSSYAAASPALARTKLYIPSQKHKVSTEALFGKKPKDEQPAKGKSVKTTVDGPMVCLECGYVATPEAYRLPFYRCGSCFAGKNRFEPVKGKKKKGGLFGR